MTVFVLTLHGGSRAFLTSRWRNVTVDWIKVLLNYVIVTSNSLCSLKTNTAIWDSVLDSQTAFLLKIVILELCTIRIKTYY